MNLEEIMYEDMDWFNLVQNKDKWRALTNTLMSSTKGEETLEYLIDEYPLKMDCVPWSYLHLFKYIQKFDETKYTINFN
jgi:hypothetical protein